MGYEFKKVDIPWLNYKLTKKATRTKIEKIALGKITRVLVNKSAKGKADEVPVLENIETESSKFIKFDVFVIDKDDDSEELDKAEYARTFALVPHKTKDKKGKSTINLRLTELYEDIDVC
ncbi:hypothetical protein C2S51_024495 [Perilla frutescens var. frutescens]|nr:hypothetical protein C2S51_024495 [Perilla frutescens var. frutescens]